MYSAANIKWVKNIKRENGTGWAYMEDGDLPEFELHFSKYKKASASTAKPGEIIVLFQRVDKMDNVEPKTYITHLVSPIDDVILDSNRENFPVSRRVKVIARGEKEKSPTVTPDELSFFKPNRGAVHDIRQLNENLSLDTLQQKVWSLFERFLIEPILSSKDEQEEIKMDRTPKIVFQNFKVFKDRTEIEFAPITVITGCNSIGKSSIMKGMMLLSDYMNNDDKDQSLLRLSGQHAKKHRLNCWENVTNWYSSNKKVTFEFKSRDYLYTFSFVADYNRVNADLSYFSISHPLRKDKLELIQLNDSIYELSVTSGFIDFYNDPIKWFSSIAPLTILRKVQNDLEKVRNAKSKILRQEELISLISEEQGLERRLALLKEKLQAEKDGGNIGLLIKKQFDIYDVLDPTTTYDRSLKAIIGDALEYYMTIEALEENEEISKSGIESNKSLSESHFKMESDKRKKQLKRTFDDLFRGKNNLRIQHLSPVRTTQARLYYRFTENDEFQKLLEWYSKTVIEGSELGFFERWMEKMAIGKSIEVHNIEGEAYIVKVSISGRKEPVDLADLGYGVGQVLAILLSILKYKGEYLMIEEPEANLHPLLQSYLAEMLHEASELFKLKFILETHSEYMIRKWQVLVAMDKMPKEQVLIYYLEEEKDKNVVPKKISIEGDGSLSDRFGEGFFDEADNQAMQLFRAQNKKDKSPIS